MMITTVFVAKVITTGLAAYGGCDLGKKAVKAISKTVNAKKHHNKEISYVGKHSSANRQGMKVNAYVK